MQTLKLSLVMIMAKKKKEAEKEEGKEEDRKRGRRKGKERGKTKGKEEKEENNNHAKADQCMEKAHKRVSTSSLL